jgi:hypothetical protein
MLSFAPYLAQLPAWPSSGRHVLAQFDADSIVVYQAFRAEIAQEAVALQRFGRGFSLERMSWIKPNFLWMMYRSGWATKSDQEHVLAVRLRRPFLERLLGCAVRSTYNADYWASREAWQAAVRSSDVRLQWDPDHDPSGNPVDRRAIQLGLRGATLREYAGSAILEIFDVTEFVAAQREHARAPYTELVTPAEAVFEPVDPIAAGATSWR